jgi:hypothetical protein
MEKPSQAPEPWHSFLRELDEKATQETRIVCMGGFVVTLLYGFSRTTADLDVLLIAPQEERLALMEAATRGGELHRKHGIYLDYVSVASVPDEYESRLTEMFEGGYERLRIYALDPYDLALSKLERNIERDREDVKHLARVAQFDLDVFRERYEKELRWQMGNPQREDLTVKLWMEMIEEDRGKK